MEKTHTNIPVKKGTKKELSKRKINAEHKNSKSITWDIFLLEATEVPKMKLIHYIPKGMELPLCGAVGFIIASNRKEDVTCKKCKEAKQCAGH